MKEEIRILALRVTRKRAGERVTVELDDGSGFEIDPEVVVRHRLKRGRPLDAETVERLQDEDDRLRARRRLVRYLALRVKSVVEARRYLEKAGFREPVIDAVVNEAVERGLLDDRRFAERFVRTRLKTGIYGPLRLLAQLLSHGIDTALAEEVLQPQFDLERQREAAEELVRKRLARTAPGTRAADPKRLCDFLERRGFQAEIAREVAARFAPKK